MAFCPKCGSSVDGRFCPSCGTNVGGDAPAAAGGGTANPAAAGLPENTASALCYFLWIITGVLFLVLEPYSKNPRVKFHAYQSIFLSIAVFALFTVVGMSLWFMPFGLFTTFLLLERLAMLALWLYMMWKSYNGEKIVLPIIGPLAEAQAAR